MKSKIKVIVIGLIILCLAGVYAIIDKAVSIYDTSCDTSAFQSITLEQGKKLEQSFVCKENHMDGISLKVAADGVLDKSQVVMAYKIIEKDSKESSCTRENRFKEKCEMVNFLKLNLIRN